MFSKKINSGSARQGLSLHVQLSSGRRAIIFDLSLHLHIYSMCASSRGYEETVQIHRLVRAHM